MRRFQIHTCMAPKGYDGKWDFERLCIIEVNPYAAAYDAPGRIVMLSTQNPYEVGSDSYKAERESQLAILRAACDGLNAAQLAD